jgi:hypothetical protein
MAIVIDLPAEVEERLREEAAKHGQETADYVKALVEQQVRLQALDALRDRQRPRSLADLKPRIPPPPGSNGFAEIIGKWPGDETDEVIQAALDELS